MKKRVGSQNKYQLAPWVSINFLYIHVDNKICWVTCYYNLNIMEMLVVDLSMIQ